MSFKQKKKWGKSKIVYIYDVWKVCSCENIKLYIFIIKHFYFNKNNK